MQAFMLPRDIALFVQSARTDARIRRLSITLGSTAAALEAVYADAADPWLAGSSKYRYQSRKYEVLAALLPTGRFTRALDVGCGQGILTRRLASIADRVVGVDISGSAIDGARRRNADQSNATFEVCDLLDLPTAFDATFDLVVVADVLYYVAPMTDELLRDIVRRIATLLKPGGTCVLANHYFFRFDPESRRSRRIHDAFRHANVFLTRSEHRRPFFLTTILCRTDQMA